MFAAVAIALSLLAAPEPAPACRFAGEPRAWTAQALEAWDRLDAARLRIARPVTPTVYLFDHRCTYELTPSRRGDFRVGRRRYASTARPHEGQVRLPDGSTIAARKLAFASPMSDGGMFFTMALPPVWRADATETRRADLLSMVVFMHEFAHTQQSGGLGARVDALLARGLPADATDDVVQDRFGGRPGYAADYTAERDAFLAAASAPDAATARERLRAGLALMQARRGRWFTGADAIYAEADDVFLTLEGSGNWAAWAWLTDPRGGRMSPMAATAFIRGSGTRWSQDEGLALMLAIDRLTPDWPWYAFRANAWTIDALAARAAGGQPSRSSE